MKWHWGQARKRPIRLLNKAAAWIGLILYTLAMAAAVYFSLACVAAQGPSAGNRNDIEAGGDVETTQKLTQALVAFEAAIGVHSQAIGDIQGTLEGWNGELRAGRDAQQAQQQALVGLVRTSMESTTQAATAGRDALTGQMRAVWGQISSNKAGRDIRQGISGRELFGYGLLVVMLGFGVLYFGWKIIDRKFLVPRRKNGQNEPLAEM